MTDKNIIKALECCTNEGAALCKNCPYEDACDIHEATMLEDTLALIKRQKSEIERLEETPKCVYAYDGEVTEYCVEAPCHNYKTADEIRAEAIKEFAERIDELFNRYAHLHKYADEARTDYIELASGEECEMQSVWDVITLNKNGLVEYETIKKASLLAEIQKDFKCLAKEMAGDEE